MRMTWLWLAGWLGACASGTEPWAADRAGPDCEGGEAYPSDAVEPMELGEVLPPYRWPIARELSTGEEAALALGEVPCAASPEIAWSPFDLLLFISVPAW